MRPQQSINYLTSHDGHTLADLLGGDVQRQFLGALLVLTSQGVPMLAEGTEMMVSKGGEHNSYDRPELNQIDWSLAKKHESLVDAVAGLIALRKSLPHFKYQGQLREGEDVTFLHATREGGAHAGGALGYVLRPPPGTPRTERGPSQVITLLNGSHEGAHFTLPEGRYRVVADGRTLEVSPKGQRTAERHYYVTPGTGVLLTRID